MSLFFKIPPPYPTGYWCSNCKHQQLPALLLSCLTSCSLPALPPYHNSILHFCCSQLFQCSNHLFVHFFLNLDYKQLLFMCLLWETFLLLEQFLNSSLWFSSEFLMTSPFRVPNDLNYNSKFRDICPVYQCTPTVHLKLWKVSSKMKTWIGTLGSPMKLAIPLSLLALSQYLAYFTVRVH